MSANIESDQATQTTSSSIDAFFSYPFEADENYQVGVPTLPLKQRLIHLKARTGIHLLRRNDRPERARGRERAANLENSDILLQ